MLCSRISHQHQYVKASVEVFYAHGTKSGGGIHLAGGQLVVMLQLQGRSNLVSLSVLHACTLCQLTAGKTWGLKVRLCVFMELLYINMPISLMRFGSILQSALHLDLK